MAHSVVNVTSKASTGNSDLFGQVFCLDTSYFESAVGDSDVFLKFSSLI